MRKLGLVPIVGLCVVLVLASTGVQGLATKKLIDAPAEGTEFIGSGIGEITSMLGVTCPNVKAGGEIYWSFSTEMPIDVEFMGLGDWKQGTEGVYAERKKERGSGTYTVPSADTWVVAFVYISEYFTNVGKRPYNMDLKYEVSYWEGGDAPKPSRGIPGWEGVPAVIALGIVLVQRKKRKGGR